MTPEPASTRAARAPGDSAARLRLVRPDVHALSHVGKVREKNEDGYLVCRVGRYLERIDSSLPLSELPERHEDTGHLMIVADGMGGMAAGEVASQTALATMVRLILEAPRWSLRLDTHGRQAELEEVQERAREFVGLIHAAVRRQAASDPNLAGMGTTLTLAYSLGADLFVAHVGDSRAYHFHDGALHKITKDHTMAQTYVDMGILDEQEASRHRMSHVLTQAVGGPAESLATDVHWVDLAAGDRLLLCSDGLTGHVAAEAMRDVLAAATSSREACERLVALALDGGGSDNVTVIVASWSA